MPELDQKIAIVTGGTGGLGAAVVAELLAAGATVFAPHTRAEAFARLRDTLPEAQRERLSGAVLDLTDEAAVERQYQEVAERHGVIDILINLAGGFGGGDPVQRTAWELWQDQLDVNLKTAVLSCKAAIPHMPANTGAILNISSRTATQPGKHVAAYGVAKRGVIGLTEALSAELRERGITVNAVLPGVIDTPTNRAANPSAKTGAWVQPAEIARVIRFLVGPDARPISGASIPVYGRS